jgi:hypothetical protein
MPAFFQELFSQLCSSSKSGAGNLCLAVFSICAILHIVQILNFRFHQGVILTEILHLVSQSGDLDAELHRKKH